MTIKVPEGMQQAGRAAYNGYLTADEGAKRILEAALLWLSENPIVPTEEQARMLYCGCPPGHSVAAWVAAEWQRRMFDAPEPEVPDAIRDLIVGGDIDQMTSGQANGNILEAYRRGQRNGGPFPNTFANLNATKAP